MPTKAITFLKDILIRNETFNSFINYKIVIKYPSPPSTSYCITAQKKIATRFKKGINMDIHDR